jgi:hypothetical protein
VVPPQGFTLLQIVVLASFTLFAVQITVLSVVSAPQLFYRLEASGVILNYFPIMAVASLGPLI